MRRFFIFRLTDSLKDLFDEGGCTKDAWYIRQIHKTRLVPETMKWPPHVLLSRRSFAR
jgi:hypothetical protein